MFILFVRSTSTFISQKAIKNWEFIKRLIGLSLCPTVKLRYQLCRVFHFAARRNHMRAGLQFKLQIEMQISDKCNIYLA